MTGLMLALGTGALLLGGLWALGGMFVPVHPRLGDALKVMDGRLDTELTAPPDGADRLGSWLRHRYPPGVDDHTAKQLQLRGIPLDRFFTYKALSALAGVVLPSLLGLLLLVTAGVSFVMPALAGLLLGFVGFFVPDIVIGRGARNATSDATESLLTFIDLVTLERLANQSATQALHAAADVSDSAVFVAIRGALQRARLEQRAPFAELKRLGEELELPALGDIADVMRLDESGAALSGALRARVKELRDAHLTQAKIEASAVSERMTVLMVLPSLIFGLIFLVPALLRLIGS